MNITYTKFHFHKFTSVLRLTQNTFTSKLFEHCFEDDYCEKCLCKRTSFDRMPSVRIRSFTIQHTSNILNKMKPILYYDDISPVVRSVLMLIDELKIDVELKYLNLFKGEHRSDEFFTISPNRTVPALKHNNYVITDSHAILIYLAEEFGGTSLLYPSDKMTRIKILDLLFFNGTNLFRKDSDLMTEIIAKSLKDLSQHSKKVMECYEALESFLSKSSFVAGNDMTIADIAIIATLSTLNLVLPVDGIRFPLLAKWYEKMKKCPFYASGNVPGLQKLRKILQNHSDLPIGLVN